MAIEITTPSACPAEGNRQAAKRISDVYLSIKVYVAPSALSVREKNQVEPETLREVPLLWLGQQILAVDVG